jgi:hypothetical protein
MTCRPTYTTRTIICLDRAFFVGQERHAQLARWTYPAAVPNDLQALVRQRVKQRAGLRCLLQPPHRQRKKPSSPSPP